MKTVEAERKVLWRFIMADSKAENPASTAAFKVLRHSEWLEAEIRRRQDTINKLRSEMKSLRKKVNHLEEELYGCGNPSECCGSSGICGSATFGWGNLDDNGYWQYPCEGCERRHALNSES